MGFITSIRVCFSKFFTFSGRGSRREYWWFAFFALIVFVFTAPYHQFSFPVWFVLFFPGLAAGSRRLHDTGKSGWWQLIWLIPLIGWIILLLLLIGKPEEGPNKYGPPLNADGMVDEDNQDRNNLRKIAYKK